MNKIIRQYVPADQKLARDVVLNGLKTFGFGYLPEYDFDLDDPQNHYIVGGGMFYVAEVDGKVVGTVAVIKKDSVAELKRLYVDQEYQGKGLGSALVDAAIQFCKDNNFKKIEFETNKKFTKAHKLYNSKGFKVVKEDNDSYYMEKELLL